MNQQFWNIQVGLNAGFILPGLYLGVRYGGGTVRSATDLEVTSHTFGVLVNYQILRPINLGVVQWRGLNFGTGYIYQTSDINLVFLINSMTSGDISIVNPSFYLNFDIATHTVPLELMTAFRAGFFQIPIGIGADLGFGSTTMRSGLRGDVIATPPDAIANEIEMERAGYITVTGPGGTASPTLTSVKIMTGLGFVFGPVFVELPFTYYFRDRGMNFGLTVGFSF